MKKFLFASAAAGALAAAAFPASANAAVTVCSSPSCVQPSSNVLFNTSMTGTTVMGTLNDMRNVAVNFTGNEALTTTVSNGQARISGADGNLNFLTFGLTGGSTFNQVEFNLNALADGTATFTFFGTGGAPIFVSSAQAISRNGQNFFGAFGENFTSVQIATTALLGDVRQVRLGGVNAAAVPEPGTWAMILLGFGAVGFSMRRRGRGSVIPQAA